ncbi:MULTISPECIES: hypothetical protein [unclassified Blastococcus]
MAGLAVLTACADGFVVTVVQPTVGAIERARSPFATWLRTSTLLLPLFVLAVLAALAFARRRVGPQLRTARPVLVAALVVVAATTAVGTAWLLVNVAVDHHLQSELLQAQAAGHPHAGAAPDVALADAQARTLELDLLAARHGGAAVLVANAVLVTWLVALRGGRIDAVRRGVTGPRPARRTPRRGDAAAGPPRGTLCAGRVDTGPEERTT